MPPEPEPRRITSLQNERVKAIRALDMRKERRETGLFVAEGAALVISARDAGWTPQTLVVVAGAADDNTIHRNILTWAARSGTEVLEVSPQVQAKLAAKDNPQTMMGVYPQRWAELPDPAQLGKGDLWLALEEIRDPGNLGTIVRTVEAVGARGVILVGNCCDPYSREAVRASMGSIFAVPLARTDRAGFLAWRRSWPGAVVGTHLDAKQDFRRARLEDPLLVVMGSEGPGLSDELRGACTELVVIPMAGRLDSLNLAIATALTLYQFRSPYLGS